MAPVPIDPETAPPTETKDDAAATGHPAGGAAPTRVDAYRSQGIRSNDSVLDLTSIVLRILTIVFTLIAFSVIASDSYSVAVFDGFGTTYHFDNYFFFSYLLTVNVITFCYALATIFLWFFLLNRSDVSSIAVIAVFALDLILSYLLMSASTSAATGMRIYNQILTGADSFIEKASAAVAFSYLAFFVLAPASLISGLRLVRRL